MFIKTRTKHASKGGIELAVFEAFGEVLAFGLGVAELVLVPLLAVLLDSGISFVHTVVYDANNKHTIKTQKGLSLSSNRKRLIYGDRSNIFGRFPNGMAKIMLGLSW